DTKFKPNMFADATVLAPPQMMEVVPTQALVLKDETDRVFVEVAPWTFEPRSVEVGFQQGDQAVVDHGLRAGERIVVKGGVLLNDYRVRRLCAPQEPRGGDDLHLRRDLWLLLVDPTSRRSLPGYRRYELPSCYPGARHGRRRGRTAHHHPA